MTYYDILEIPTTATKAQIKAAYLKLAKEFHPDKSAGVSPAVRKLVEEKFKDIQEAFEILSKHRSEYDNQLRSVAPPSPPPPSPPPPPPKQARSSAAPKTASSQPYVAPKPPKTIPNWGGGLIALGLAALLGWGSTNTTSKPSGTVDTPSRTTVQIEASTRTPPPMADAQGFCGTAGYPDCMTNAVNAGRSNIRKEREATTPSLVSQTRWAIVITQYGTNIYKRCHFNVGNLDQRCGSYLANEEIAAVKTGDKVQVLSQKIRASGGLDIYEVRFNHWTGWMDSSTLSEAAPDIARTPRSSEAEEVKSGTGISREKSINSEISRKFWRHSGSTTPERLSIWIDQNHLYESAEPWSIPTQDNVKHSTYCDTVKGATASLGPPGLYVGECTYTITWIKERKTCATKTVEVITFFSPTGFTGWSQHVDNSPLQRYSCPVAGTNGATFTYEPAPAAIVATSSVPKIPNQRVCVKGTEICSDVASGEPSVPNQQSNAVAASGELKSSKQRICIKGTEICSDAK